LPIPSRTLTIQLINKLLIQIPSKTQLSAIRPGAAIQHAEPCHYHAIQDEVIPTRTKPQIYFQHVHQQEQTIPAKHFHQQV
jgi:mannitol/fructose-specific phosphotransferase system IIA component (Ntr-type)